MGHPPFKKDLQYYKFCLYGFLRNLRFFDPFLVLFFLEKNLTYTQIGTLYAIRELATNLLEIPTGFLSDTFGRRHTMIISFVFYILSFIIFYVFSGFLFFVFAMIFYAIGDAFRTGTHKAMIFDYLKNKGWSDQKVSYYGHTRSWSQIGSAVSSLIAAGIVFYTGNFRAVFLYSIIPYLLDLILIMSYPKSLDGPVSSLKKINLNSRFGELINIFLNVFKNIETLKIVNSLSLHSGYFKSVKDYLQPILHSFALGVPVLFFLEDKKRSALIIGAIYFIIFFLSSIASKKAGKVASYYKHLNDPLNLSLMIGLIAGMLSGAFYHFGFLHVAVILFIFIFLVENLRKPIGVGHFAERIDDHVLAAALSAQSQAKTLWGALIAVGTGSMVDHFGVGAGLVIISGWLLVLGWLSRLR
ncbi:MAG: MFS transporter [Bacteroidota bacterium]